MASISRQQSLLVAEDWKKVYQTFRQADFQSFDFETLRKSMIDYLKIYHPEDFNDFIDSSEYIALIDMIAFLGQSLAFRMDLNARENFIDTAERRDSILKLARLISYSPKRNIPASGYLKIKSVSTTENVNDSAGTNLANTVINWADINNADWQEQFNSVLNAAMFSTQRVGRPAAQTIVGPIKYQQYQMNLVAGSTPVVPFETKINGITTRFELVGTTIDNDILRETYPSTRGTLDMLYKNDGQGTTSGNTGFFLKFIQGSIAYKDFEIAESLSNRTVSVNIDNINNSDVWLFDVNDQGASNTLWKPVPAVASSNIVYNTATNFTKKIYQISSRNNDQIDLTFGDGNFSQIPVGNFRLYYRVSNGLTYRILPSDLTQVEISIDYVSRKNRTESMTMVLSLETAVSNAAARETINEIRQRAPQQYYTQNRMVNGEDYNIFPYTQFANIIKSKAVNRTSSGISRYLDVIDVTGKHSSTNIYGDDGIMYSDESPQSFTFEFLDSADILNLITTRIQTILGQKSSVQYYYANFPRLTSTFVWYQSSRGTNLSTGYFTKNNTIVPVGLPTSAVDGGKYLRKGALIKFAAPTGYYFDNENNLQLGTPSKPGQRLYIYSAISSVINDGTNSGLGNFIDGSGPISLNDRIPTGAVIKEIIPPWENFFPDQLITNINKLIKSYRDFGLRFNHYTGTWEIVAGEMSNAVFDQSSPRQSWIMKFTASSNIYTVTYRSLRYIFESELQTRFYFDTRIRIFDLKTGQLVVDQVRILKTNSRAENNLPLVEDYVCYVQAQIVESDGFVDSRKIEISFSDRDSDGVADNPDFFQEIVYAQTNTNLELVPSGDIYKSIVFYLRTTAPVDVYESWTPIAKNLVNLNYLTRAAVVAAQAEYPVGQLFYAINDGILYRLNSSRLLDNVLVETDIKGPFGDIATAQAYIRSNTTAIGQIFFISRVSAGQTFTTYYRYLGTSLNIPNLLAINNSEINILYKIQTGRQNLFYQYKHNAPNYRRIDPSPTNIIDLFILTRQYNTDYRLWAQDVTGTVKKPPEPTPEELLNDFVELNDYKMVSDSIIFNSARFKTLFGPSAETNLRATFKVVKTAASLASDSEVKAALISAVNDYFAVDNWDFGETFYFSELSAYLHQRLVPMVSSIVIVPAMVTLGYGVLQQINAEYNEILISTATVEDVKIIPAISAAQINTKYIV
jgi:hypothetical protein